jgi:hypothetical protein
LTALPSLPAAIQERLTRFYALEHTPVVDPFVRIIEDDDARERLLVRTTEDGLELALELPAAAMEASEPYDLDRMCQIVEGVSHFVLIAERARRALPTTQLELELQAEIDKLVVLADLDPDADAIDPRAHLPRVRELQTRLFGAVRFLHPVGSVCGDRYRMANRLAAGYARSLESRFIRQRRLADLRAELRQFYRHGQAAKLSLVRAA